MLWIFPITVPQSELSFNATLYVEMSMMHHIFPKDIWEIVTLANTISLDILTNPRVILGIEEQYTIVFYISRGRISDTIPVRLKNWFRLLVLLIFIENSSEFGQIK